MNWVEFVSWLSISEDKMEGLDQSLVGGSRVNLSDQLKQLQVNDALLLLLLLLLCGLARYIVYCMIVSLAVLM